MAEAWTLKEPLVSSGEFPFFWPLNSQKFIMAKSQILAQSPTLGQFISESIVDRLIQTGIMFSNGGDGLLGTKLAIQQHYLKLPSTPNQAEIMLTQAVETIAGLSLIEPVAQPERAREEGEKAFRLAKELKEGIKTVFEEPSNEISVIASINDAASALRDISLYLRHPDFFAAVAKIVTDRCGVPLQDLYNTEFHSRLVREILERNIEKGEVREAVAKAHIVGGIKSISSQLYAIGVGDDQLEEMVKQWRNDEKIVEHQLEEQVSKIDDKIRMQLYLPDTQTFNTLANILVRSVPMQKIILRLRRFPQEMRDNLKAHIWVSHYPPKGQVSSETVAPGNDPAAQVVALLKQDLNKGQICYGGLHAYLVADVPAVNREGKKYRAGVPVEIQLRLGQGPLRALYRAGSMIRRSIGEGGVVPPYQEIFGDGYYLITEKAKAELREIE